MTMLSIFEEQETARHSDVLDVICARCGGRGRLATRDAEGNLADYNGRMCDGCFGAGWLVLGNHPDPCMACSTWRRAQRPAPPGLAAVVASPLGRGGGPESQDSGTGADRA